MLREEVQSFLLRQKIRLDKDLGQHFLVSEDALDAMIETSNLTDRDNIIEVGPGIGVLTRELTKRVGHVTSVEIDPRFPFLIKAFTENPKNMTILHGNALHAELPTQQPYKIVANIPYHITSPLLHRFLLEEKRRPTSMTMLIQREVAENICHEGTASVLTLLVQLFGQPSLVLRVPPSAFMPPPKVDSAILHIKMYEQPKGTPVQIKEGLKLLKHASTGRRKMLRNTLANLPHGKEAMEKAKIDPTRRPQSLSVSEWMALADEFLARI